MKSFYDRLIGEGKAHKVALTAVMRNWSYAPTCLYAMNGTVRPLLRNRAPAESQVCEPDLKVGRFAPGENSWHNPVNFNTNRRYPHALERNYPAAV